MIKDWKKEIFTIPNFLSLLRLVLIPFYLTIYLNAKRPQEILIAAAIFGVSCVTDFLDGFIARKFNMISQVGKLLDPLADKATQFSLIVCIAVEFPILWALCPLFVIKEAFQLIAIFVTYRKGYMLNGALLSGKICTCVLFTSLIVILLFHRSISGTAVMLLTIADAAFMLNAFIHYIITFTHSTSMMDEIPTNLD